MKLDEKLDLVSRVLYENRDYGTQNSLRSTLDRYNIPYNGTKEIDRLFEALESQNIIKVLSRSSGHLPLFEVTSNGISFVESTSFSRPQSSILDLTHFEPNGFNSGLISFRKGKATLSNVDPSLHDLKSNISEGEILKVIPFLLNYLDQIEDSEGVNRLVNISARLKRHQSAFFKGLVKWEDVDINANLAITDLLDLIDSLKIKEFLPGFPLVIDNGFWGLEDTDDLISDNTIIIVTGCHPNAEIFDRPIAISLKESIDKFISVKPNGQIRSIIIGDYWYYRQFNKSNWRPKNVISIGGNRVNSLSDEIKNEGSSISESPITTIYQKGTKIALFGDSAYDTFLAVRLFKTTLMEGYLNSCFPHKS